MKTFKIFLKKVPFARKRFDKAISLSDRGIAEVGRKNSEASDYEATAACRSMSVRQETLYLP